MLTFGEFLSQNWSHQVQEPWPQGNDLFAESVLNVAKFGGLKEIHRPRGQGTTTLLLALADYATEVLQIDYVMYLTDSGDAAQCYFDSFLSKTCALWMEDRLAEIAVGRRIVEFCGIRSSFRGKTRSLNGKLLRPQLTLIDLVDRRGKCPVCDMRLNQAVADATHLHGPHDKQRTLIVWTRE